MLPADIALGLLVIERRFCRTPACAVLYYGDDGRIVEKDAAHVRVGVKESEGPIHVCYCFDVTREALRSDLAENGDSKLLLRIREEVRAGNCACETKNPSGACCLGEVNAVVKEEKRRLEQVRRDVANEAIDESCKQGCCGG